jgi:hypothetical protein
MICFEFGATFSLLTIYTLFWPRLIGIAEDGGGEQWRAI